MTIARTIADILRTHPYPGVSGVLITDDGDLDFTLDGATVPLDGELWRLDEVEVRLDADGWNTSGLTRRCLLSPSDTLTPEAVHAEIGRVLRLAAESPHTSARLDHRLTDEIDRRKDVEAQLTKVTAERDAALAAPSQRLALLDDLLTRLGAKSGGALEALDRLDLTIETLRGERDRLLISEDTLSKIAAALAIPALEPYDDALSMVRRLVDAHAVVSQRLVGAQQEVAERDATIDELRTALESIAAHVGLVGSDQWAVGDVVVKVGELNHELDAAIARSVKARQRRDADDALRSQIAVAVGLDGSASLALILDTVTRDRPDDPRAVNGLRALVAYHQAPIAFNDRPLTVAERAAFVIHRLWQGRTNAANEAAALRRELSDIADALGDLPDTAEREPIGDREEHLGLSTAERLRLHFGARS